MANLTDVINSRTNQVTLEGTRTNFVDDSVLDIITASSGLGNLPSGILLASARAYKDNAGKFRLTFNVSYTTALSVQNSEFRMAGVSISTTHRQALAGLNGFYNSGPTRTNIANNSFKSENAQANSTWFVSGDILLDSEPTWFQDNLQTASGLPVATADSYGVAKQGLVAKKEAARASRTPGMLTPFQFNNLDIGKHYEYRAILNCAGAVGGEVNLLLNIYSNSAPLATNDWDFQSVSGINYEGVVTISYIWKTQAGQTDVGTQLISMGAGGAAIGGVSFLIERPDLDLSSGYTSKYD